MDTRLNDEKYQQIIKQVLRDYVEYYRQGGVILRPLFDDSQKNYLLLKHRWEGNKYIHHAPIHIEIINHQIWIQNDDTQEGVATDLLKAGIEKQDIVLGFQPPNVLNLMVNGEW